MIFIKCRWLHDVKTMPKKFIHQRPNLTPDDIFAAIQMAWEDRTAFETIKERIDVKLFPIMAQTNEGAHDQASCAEKPRHEI